MHPLTLTGKGMAHHDSVDGTVLVQLVDLLLHLFRFAGRIELVLVKIHTAAQRQLLLLLNETFGIGIVSEANQRKTGNHSRFLLDMAQAQGRLPVKRCKHDSLSR